MNRPHAVSLRKIGRAGAVAALILVSGAFFVSAQYGAGR